MLHTDFLERLGVSGSFSRRITLVILLVLAVTLLGSTIGYWSLFEVSMQTNTIAEDVIPAERLTSELQRHIVVNVARSKAYAISSEPQVGDALMPEIEQTSQQIHTLLKQLDKMLTTPNDKLILGQMVFANTHFATARDELTKARDSGLTSRIETVYASRFTPAAQDLQDAVMLLGDSQRSKIGTSVMGIGNRTLIARWGLILFSIVALCLGMILSRWLVRSITVPIEQALHTANLVASLDLTTAIEGHDRDEAGRLLVALGQMQNALRALVVHVQGASHCVAEGATQIAAGNLDFSNRTEMTASYLQQTNSAIEEVTATMNASLESATRGKALAQSASLEAANGSAAMSEVMQTMNDIHESSRQIMDIIDVIDSITFQTNLLALNASIEAALAGEQGRGFAVVATEVRALATRSARAAQEIQALIDATANKVTLGAIKVQQAHDTMNTIVQAVEQVTVAIGEIHAGNYAQTCSISSINRAVNHLDDMAQHNAAMVEESAAAAQNLQDQAGGLRDVTHRFRLPDAVMAPYWPVQVGV